MRALRRIPVRAGPFTVPAGRNAVRAGRNAVRAGRNAVRAGRNAVSRRQARSDHVDSKIVHKAAAARHGLVRFVGEASAISSALTPILAIGPTPVWIWPRTPTGQHFS